MFTRARSVQPKLFIGDKKGINTEKSRKFKLDHRILEPDSQFTYLEFLERNPLSLSMQKLNGRMEHKMQKKLDLNKIEETYWSHWKPNKNGIFFDGIEHENKKSIPKTQKSTSGEGDRNYNIKNDGSEVRGKIYPIAFKQSDHLSKIDEVTEDDKDVDAASSMSNIEESKNFRFLRHTDSFILNSKKQSEEKSHYQQPRCIRLYKKNSSASYIKGGSYPLKPCLKKESTFKGYTRRPLSGIPYSASLFKSIKHKTKPK